MIKRYRCDKPMAIKKGIRQVCDRQCKDCVCAIAKSGNGEEHHVGLTESGSCTNVLRRNQAKGLFTRLAPEDERRRLNDRKRVDWRFDRRRGE